MAFRGRSSLENAKAESTYNATRATLERTARSAKNKIAAGTSISTPVLVASVRAEIPTSSKRPHR